MHLLAISGSLRAASTNRSLIEAFRRHAPKTMSIVIFDRLGGLPIFNPDLEGETPPSVSALADAVARSRGLVIASPEYAHGIPGGLKNALDWLVSGFEMPAKPVMLVHASSRGLTSRQHLREVLTTMHCNVYPGPEFELHLIGKQPAETEALLDTPDASARIRQSLSAFGAFVSEASDSAKD